MGQSLTARSILQRKVLAQILSALVLFLCATYILFYTGVYKAYLDPNSSTGAFEVGLRRIEKSSLDIRKDVLVLGDSRVFSGLDVATADKSSQGKLNFLNAGIPGTTPRCWFIFEHALSEQSLSYRAVVIPVDTYSDDDSAIGSIDGDNREMDLHYIALETPLSQIFKISSSFPESRLRIDSFFELLLRGSLIRQDIQAFFASPLERLEELKKPSNDPATRAGSLIGLSVNYTRHKIVLPPAYHDVDQSLYQAELLHKAAPSASYAKYRREWLGPIVEHYRHLGIPVVFVRIPTRPIHQTTPGPPSGVLEDFASSSGVTLVDQSYPVSLEQPRYFIDADHLNDTGARLFSAWLGREVIDTLQHNTFRSSPDRAPMHANVPQQDNTQAAMHRFPLIAKIVSFMAVGVPILFQSFEFMAFVLVVLVAYWFIPSFRVRNGLLLVVSWYFYARWNAYYLFVLIALSVLDYLFGRAIESLSGFRRHLAFILGVSANLLFLGTAKYADFLTGTVAGLLGMRNDPWALHVLIPIGISFHTFQSVSYLCDVYAKKTRAVRSFAGYALFLAFFPQLLAGPIVRAGTFFRELSDSRRFAFRVDNLAIGSTRILSGLIKKSVFADRFGAVSDTYFLNPQAHPGLLAALSAVLAFAMQIYFDFSGYSDIAIGTARMFGFEFPENFRRPYLAWSVSEFWRRWHMTLSQWLRDYVYIPLGGNRNSSGTTARNLMVTMLLGGLWHGANWTFVAWGAYHGLLLVAEKASGLADYAARTKAQAVHRTIFTSLTFALVCIGWSMFRSPSFSELGIILVQAFSGVIGHPVLSRGLLIVILFAALYECFVERLGRFWNKMHVVWNVLGSCFAMITFELAAFTDSAAQFIYFRF